MNMLGLAAGIAVLALTGLAHIMIIKGEYHFGVKLWPVFLVIGIVCLAGSFFVNNYLSAILGITSALFLFSIWELFQQRERVRKGHFPKKNKD